MKVWTGKTPAALVYYIYINKVLLVRHRHKSKSELAWVIEKYASLISSDFAFCSRVYGHPGEETAIKLQRISGEEMHSPL